MSIIHNIDASTWVDGIMVEQSIFQEEPLKKKLLRNWFWLYFFSFIGAPAWYLIKVMVSQTLSVEDIGIVYSIIWLITILSTYNDLWLTEALQYYLPHYMIDKEYDKAKTLLIFTTAIQLLSWVIIAAILFWVAPWLSIHYFHHPDADVILRYFCIYFLIINFFQVLQTIFLALQYVKLYNLVDLCRIRSIVILTAYGLYHNSLSALHFAQYWIIWVILWTLLGVLFFWHKMRWIITDYTFKRDRALIKKQLKYALWVLLGANAGILLLQIDQQFALYFLWPQAAWYWTNYLTLQTAVSIFTTPIITYLAPLLNELYKKKEHEKIAYLRKLLYIWVLIFGFFVWVIWWFWWDTIAVLFFWEKFRISWELFGYVAPFIFLNILAAINFQQLVSMGYIKNRVKILFTTVISNIIFSILFIKIMWIHGLLLSSIIWWMILFFLTSYDLRKIK